jgi:hypothetical protein
LSIERSVRPIEVVIVFPLAQLLVERLDALANREERLRLNVTQGHTYEDMDKALELLRQFPDSFSLVDTPAESTAPQPRDPPIAKPRTADRCRLSGLAV